MRLFHTFPGGRTGVGIFLLRSATGLVIITQAGTDLISRPGLRSWNDVFLSITLLTGIMLIIGLLTPLAAALAGLDATGVLFSIVPSGGAPDLFASKLSCLLVAASAAALILLGPGAFSIDVRLFGWHEVILPPRPDDSNE